MITEEELESPRKPSELSAYIENTFLRIESDEAEKSIARLWEGQYKELIREVNPASIFCAWKFPNDDVLVRPRIGNQGYDAEIIQPPSTIIARIEVGWPISGKQEKEDARALNEKGCSGIRIEDREAGKQQVRDRVISTLKDKDKTKKDYSDCYLLIVISLWPAFFMDNPQDRADFEKLISEMRSVQTSAKGVFAVLMPPEYIEKVGLPPVIQI